MPTVAAKISNGKRQRPKAVWREQGVKPVRTTIDNALLKRLAEIVGLTDPTDVEAMRAPLAFIASEHQTSRHCRDIDATRPQSNACVKAFANHLGRLATKLDALPSSAHEWLGEHLPFPAYFHALAAFPADLEDVDMLRHVEFFDELADHCANASREFLTRNMAEDAANLKACAKLAEELSHQLIYLDKRGQQSVLVELVNLKETTSLIAGNDPVAMALTIIRQMTTASHAAYVFLAAERGPESDTTLWISVQRLATLFEQWAGKRATHSVLRHAVYASQGESDFDRFCRAFFEVVDKKAVQLGLPDAITMLIRLRSEACA